VVPAELRFCQNLVAGRPILSQRAECSSCVAIRIIKTVNWIDPDLRWWSVDM
jgi:hypothetical protein